jgi:mannose-6-phosphate isomerase-like protein (cupin superfamily)
MDLGNKYVVHITDAVCGVLHGRAGTFRILIDAASSGAKHFSLLINTMHAGVKGAEHKHAENEHCWYILSGRGTIFIAGQPHPIGPQTAVYVPADTLHKIEVDPQEDLTYVVIYAPPGPEQLLKTRGERAFDEKIPGTPGP